MNPAVRVTALGGAPNVRILPAETRPLSAEAGESIDRAWRSMCAGNPNLHDGPVLAVESIDGAAIVCRRSSYKMFVAGPAGGIVVRSLGVTGVCVRGTPAEVLMGRRAAGVRIYGSLWETAPRGGVEAAPTNPTHPTDAMSGDDLANCVLVEAREELGIAITPRRWFAIVEDPGASSVDLCLLCDAGADEVAGSWEYSARRWTPASDVRDRATGRVAEAELLSPPCAALAASPCWEEITRI